MSLSIELDVNVELDVNMQIEILKRAAVEAEKMMQKLKRLIDKRNDETTTCSTVSWNRNPLSC